MPEEKFTIRPATRQAIIPVVGVMGESGGGKTLTSLFIARGMAGPNAKIAGVDTENKRMQIFSSMVPGGFDVLDLNPPFSPQRYQAAISELVRAGYKAIVVDSATHEWAGEGGYLDLKDEVLTKMAGDDWQKREKCGMAAAARCKPHHNRFVDFSIRLPVPLIMCFRAFAKTKIGKEQGRTTISTDTYISPVQDDRFIFEMLIAGETYANADGQGGFWSWKGRGKKYTHPDILTIFPEGEQIGVQHGEALARWCARPAERPEDKKTTAPASTKVATDATRKFMLEQFSDLHQKMLQYGIDKGIIMPDQGLDHWPLDRVPTSRSGLVELRKQIEAHQ